ncbi:AfsR/SARP family transcriptional regulator [Saccharothrix deserti]|uniref:AfsR/SARP family transcriptional regulator n=1 Tax=Saccharothrix deserti TaxID=2593674 RepID=UPI00131D4575|nr:AfsR/SARP family transcriptional regulator [Saccharothrix deserti]
MQFRMLGPLEVQSAGRQVRINAAKQRTVVAMLLVNAGREVPVDALVTEVWGQDPPRSAVPNLRTYVMKLRALLSADAVGVEQVLTTRSGYLLRADPDDIDLHRFESTLGRARKAIADAELDAAETAFESALALWRGEAAQDVALGPSLRDVVDRLAEQHAEAVEDYADIKIAMGDHVAAIERLRGLVDRYPLRERAYGQLMSALYRRGDVNAALLMYRKARKMLIEELGVEPGPDLSSLHQAILRRDPDLAPADTAAKPAVVRGMTAGPPPRPHELPRNPATFVGRVTELDRIRGVLRTFGAVSRVVVIHGAGGIGKSALAQRAAYTVVDDFPDGLLYADLQGATPGLVPLAPAETLGRFLRALGVARGDLPAGQAEAETRFQSMLAGRRLLLVLDNAASAGQVTPLLPAYSGCAVLVTSRVVLPTLDALPVGLHVLQETDAVRLLALTAGERRVAAEHDAAVEIARRCGYHPLALRIAGARLAGRPDWSLARFHARLGDQRRRLDELRVDDLDVRSSFAVSYEALRSGTEPGRAEYSRTESGRTGAATAFRLLGTLGVPEFGAELVAALVGVDLRTAEDALDELVAVRLVEAVAEGRFKIHDLLRLYAAEVAEQELSADERNHALARALDWYLERGRAVVDDPDDPDDPADEAGPSPDRTAALQWFDTELPCLVAAATHASALEPEPARFVIDLLALVKPLAHKRGCWHELEVLSRLALDVATRLGDTAGQHVALATLASVDWRAGRVDEARESLLRGLELARAAGDLELEVRAVHNLGWLGMRQGDTTGAFEHMTAAVELLGDRRDSPITGVLWHNHAEILLRLDRCAEALDSFTVSLAARRARGDRLGESITLAGLARAHCLLDQQDRALAVIDEAIRHCQEVGNQEDEWEVLLCRSEIWLRRNDTTAAVTDLHRAAELAAAVGDRYGQAAILRQRARARAAEGDRTGAALDARRAEAQLAAPAVQPDPVLEKLLNP